VEPLGPAGDLSFSGEWRTEVSARARREVEALLSATGGSASMVGIQEGETAKTVCSFATEVGADLLVIGRGPRDAMAGRLTTHAYAIIRQSPCPVISI
jgi:nucleotide-binding universal stress UspA family protein